jgi:hypothetical protein
VNGNCQGDRRFECYYADLRNFEPQWCRDRDDFCPSIDDAGGLVKVVDHQAPPPPSGGGW